MALGPLEPPGPRSGGPGAAGASSAAGQAPGRPAKPSSDITLTSQPRTGSAKVDSPPPPFFIKEAAIVGLPLSDTRGLSSLLGALSGTLKAQSPRQGGAAGHAPAAAAFRRGAEQSGRSLHQPQERLRRAAIIGSHLLDAGLEPGAAAILSLEDAWMRRGDGSESFSKTGSREGGGISDEGGGGKESGSAPDGGNAGADGGSASSGGWQDREGAQGRGGAPEAVSSNTPQIPPRVDDIKAYLKGLFSMKGASCALCLGAQAPGSAHSAAMAAGPRLPRKVAGKADGVPLDFGALSDNNGDAAGPRDGGGEEPAWALLPFAFRAGSVEARGFFRILWSEGGGLAFLGAEFEAGRRSYSLALRGDQALLRGTDASAEEVLDAGAGPVLAALGFRAEASSAEGSIMEVRA
jgi:hypothetical protein